MRKTINVYIFQIDDCEPQAYSTIEDADNAVREEIEFWRQEDQRWLSQEEIDAECDNAWTEYSQPMIAGNYKSTNIFGHTIVVYLSTMEIDI